MSWAQAIWVSSLVVVQWRVNTGDVAKRKGPMTVESICEVSTSHLRHLGREDLCDPAREHLNF